MKTEEVQAIVEEEQAANEPRPQVWIRQFPVGYQNRKARRAWAKLKVRLETKARQATTRQAIADRRSESRAKERAILKERWR